MLYTINPHITKWNVSKFIELLCPL